jgi:TRAP-type transport system small permease protein
LARVLKGLDRVLFGSIAVLLGVMVVDVAIQVVFRYIVYDPPAWTEELARYVFVWQIFLAAALAFGRGSHIVVDALQLLVSGVVVRLLMIAADVVVFGFMLVLAWQGTNMARLTSDTTSTALEINMGAVYAALPVSAAISALYVLCHVISLVRGETPTKTTNRVEAVD